MCETGSYTEMFTASPWNVELLFGFPIQKNNYYAI